MSEKVYGICGTNKCRKEVVPKEEYDNKISTLVPKDWIYTFTLYQAAFTRDSTDNYYFAEVVSPFGNNPQFTVDCIVYGDYDKQYAPASMESSIGTVLASTGYSVYYGILLDDPTKESASLYITINENLYNLMNFTPDKDSLIFICRRYA